MVWGPVSNIQETVQGGLEKTTGQETKIQKRVGALENWLGG